MHTCFLGTFGVHKVIDFVSHCPVFFQAYSIFSFLILPFSLRSRPLRCHGCGPNAESNSSGWLGCHTCQSPGGNYVLRNFLRLLVPQRASPFSSWISQMVNLLSTQSVTHPTVREDSYIQLRHPCLFTTTPSEFIHRPKCFMA